MDIAIGGTTLRRTTVRKDRSSRRPEVFEERSSSTEGARRG
ncbi:hypothetical protein [Methanoculleus sp.]|nr:hypothetical protein [Methanoculleus sp.]